MKKGKKTQIEVDSMIQLANEVQYAVLTRKLGPGECFLFMCGIGAHMLSYSNEDILQPYGIPAARRCPCADIVGYRAHDDPRG